MGCREAFFQIQIDNLGGIYLERSKTNSNKISIIANGIQAVTVSYRIRFGGPNSYWYGRNNPLKFTDPYGLLIVDKTGGKIPKEVTDSRLYRKLDGDILYIIEIKLDPTLEDFGENTYYYGSYIQDISINPILNYNRNELINTYIHELNHADLNITFGDWASPRILDMVLSA